MICIRDSAACIDRRRAIHLEIGDVYPLKPIFTPDDPFPKEFQVRSVLLKQG